MSNNRFYKIWMSIKGRCYCRNDTHYNYYGGRGITMCDYWKKFENFIKDMHDSYKEHCDIYGERETTIDRIDYNGNYELCNCKWSTYKEQANNKSSNCTIFIDDILYTATECSEKYNIPYETMRKKIRNGSPIDDILTPSPRKKAKKQSGVKGVTWNENSNMWLVTGIKNGINHTYLVCFKVLEDALTFKKEYDKKVNTDC